MQSQSKRTPPRGAAAAFRRLASAFAVALAVVAGCVLTAPAMADIQSPEKAISSDTDQMRALIRQNHEAYQKDPAKFYAAVNEQLVPHFDTRYIAQLVLGRNWRTATDDQRTRFQNAFRDMLVNGYADKLLEYYDSVNITFKPVALAPGQTDATVDSTVQRSGGQPPIAITFKVHVVDGDWKIYDVIAENISLVFNFRTQIDAEIKKTSLDDVIARFSRGEVIKPPVDAGAGKPQ